jgi:hypothetical protein
MTHLFVSASIFVFFIVPDYGAGAAPQKQPSVHRTLPSDVRTACNAAYVNVAKIPGTSIRRRTGTFSDETLLRPVFGCGLAISGSFAQASKTGDAASRLRDNFSAQGWQEMPAYGADGTDGTSFAFHKAGVACLVRGTWAGGADDEPETPPLDWYKVTFFCTSPIFPDER